VEIFALSLDIFNPPSPREDYLHKNSVWKKHFKDNGILIGAFVEDQLAGYVFFYDREKESGSSHCWMAGVAEKFRGKGLLSALMGEAQKQLKSKGYQQMTINTYSEKFPIMYSYLTKHKFELYKEEEKQSQGKMIRKSFFKKKVVN
jgi:ribosomal protein S18 acetylase RimI-like enzyme